MTKGGSVGLSKKQVGMFAVALPNSAKKMWMSTKETEDRTKEGEKGTNRKVLSSPPPFAKVHKIANPNRKIMRKRIQSD